MIKMFGERNSIILEPWLVRSGPSPPVEAKMKVKLQILRLECYCSVLPELPGTEHRFHKSRPCSSLQYRIPKKKLKSYTKGNVIKIVWGLYVESVTTIGCTKIVMVWGQVF